jgi:hypothetical protein
MPFLRRCCVIALLPPVGRDPRVSSGQHGSIPSFKQRPVPILERHGVDLVLAGDDRDHQRGTRLDQLAITH